MTTKTPSDIMSQWVATGEFGPEPPGGWTVPRLVSAIRKEMAARVSERVHAASGRHEEGFEYIDVESVDRYLEQAIGD